MGSRIADEKCNQINHISNDSPIHYNTLGSLELLMGSRIAYEKCNKINHISNDSPIHYNTLGRFEF
jgi:hypothetical protein